MNTGENIYDKPPLPGRMPTTLTKRIPQTGETNEPLEDSEPLRNNIPSRIQPSELKETGTEICTYLGCLNLDLIFLKFGR